MSEPSPQSQPNRQVLINDVDCTPFSISTQVELNENGIPMATLIADNEDAKNFLATLVIGDTVEIKGLADSPEGYYIENLVTWSSVIPFFVGTIQELTPDLSSSGQVTGVMCLGVGFHIKEMKVNAWYGDITNLPQIANTIGFTDQIKNWSGGGYNQSPYIGCYSGSGSFNSLYQYTNQNYIQLNSESLGGYIGGFNFALTEDYDYNQFNYCKLHIVVGVYNNSSGNHINSATVTPFYSIDNGGTWHAFTGNNGKANRAGSLTTYNTLNGTFPPVLTNVSATGGLLGYGIPANDIDWLIPITWIYDGTYNPLADYVHGPPQGEDDYLDITTDMNNIGGFMHNLQIKLQFSGCTNQTTGSGVTIVYMYLEYQFNTFAGFTARQMLAGDSSCRGIIPNYVNSTLNGLLDSSGNPILTGYPTIGTAYIVADETTDTLNKIPNLTLPYNDAFQAINDVLRYGSGLKLLQGLAGYHWRLDILGNLLSAPVNNHHVTGVDGSHYVDAVPNTIPWVLRPYSSPIVVKQSMITQNFKQVVPKGNLILINGRYQYPSISVDPFQGYNIDSWYSYWIDATGAVHYTANQPYVVSNEPQIAGNCLRFACIVNLLAQYANVWTYPLPSDLDLTKLMGRNTSPEINGLIKTTGGIVGAQIRLYWANPSDPAIPDISQFAYYDISDQLNQNNFIPFSIKLPNTKFFKDFKGWSMGQDLGFFNSVFNALRSTTHTLYEIGSAAFFGIVIFTGLTGATGQVFAEVSDFSISGSIVRGVYDPNNVSGPFTYPPSGINYGTQNVYANGFGERVISIKNSLLYTNDMTPSHLNNYIGLELIYELWRSEIPYITGEIMIPFDPTWLDGQQVWIQAEDVIPLGVQVVSGSSNPTTSTSCNGIGSYYVNTVSWEVYLCTNVVGATYTWTDQNTVRYKINQWFRILKVIHRFNNKGATTSLQLTNDLFTSFPINTLDSYTTIIRATNPDFQTHTNASLKIAGDFDQGLTPIITPYSPTF